MLILLSPAKTLDFDTPSIAPVNTQPAFLSHAAKLIDVLRGYSPDELGQLMKLSPALSELNTQRYHDWQLPFNESNAKAAILAFKGDVYTGLEAENWSSEQLQDSQQSIRILSGLYGLLRPLDLIQPYRLEMGTKLNNPSGKDLYQFWDETITDQINQECQDNNYQVIVNLASNEYFKSVKTKKLNTTLVTPIFKDEKNGQFKIISFYAKKARGMMAAYLVKNQVQSIADITNFAAAGYQYDEELSSANELVFKRYEKDIPSK